jgi:hypothetical protein
VFLLVGGLVPRRVVSIFILYLGGGGGGGKTLHKTTWNRHTGNYKQTKEPEVVSQFFILPLRKHNLFKVTFKEEREREIQHGATDLLAKRRVSWIDVHFHAPCWLISIPAVQHIRGASKDVQATWYMFLERYRDLLAGHRTLFKGTAKVLSKIWDVPGHSQGIILRHTVLRHRTFQGNNPVTLGIPWE